MLDYVNMRTIVIIAHDIRSTHNVGSILRTADGFGIKHLYFTGITPYPVTSNDSRLPHISKRISAQISKTALGAENYLSWSHEGDLNALIMRLKQDKFRIIGLEQSPRSIKLNSYKPPDKCAIILGEEVNGIPLILQQSCDDLLEITMYGKKESFNVAQATAIALYVLRET